MLQKENNPWVGLASYKSQDAGRFYGRENETRKLSELIQSNYCTILYGKSGAGKTSLIQAGVCPLLAAEHYLPISMTLDHGSPIPYARQITAVVEEQLRSSGGEVEFPFALPEGLDEDSRAWLFFHAATFWDGQNYRTIPAVFIDQFEELFNLTEDPSLVLGFFRTIDTLLQMTPPETVSEAFARNDARLSFHEKPAFRLMLSLREDFLARLEDYSFSIPALRKNRIGLASMNGLQAMQVITRPIPGLVEREAALRILSKVTASDVQDDEYFLGRISVDTCILSLFCTEIYNRSAESGKDCITMDIIDQFGNNIIQTFYERNMDEISAASAQYLESHLLTTNGFRNQVALEDLVPDHVKEKELRKLEANRIVRIETVNGTERVEFTHDVLCKVARNHRSARNSKQEHRKTVIRNTAYVAEALLHFGLFASFILASEMDSFAIIRNAPVKWALLGLAFLSFFLIRLGHHSRRFKSPLVMAVSAIFSFIPMFAYLDAPDTGDGLAIFSSLYALSGLVYPFLELAQARRSQHILFLGNSIRLKDDRPRWLAVLAFLVLSFLCLSVYAHRLVNGALSFLLILAVVPLIAELICFLFPEKVEFRAIWKYGLAAEGGMLLLAASQYCHSRIWYYAALVALAATCLVFCWKNKGAKTPVSLLAGLAVWVLGCVLLPTYILGYKPSLPGNWARVPHGTIATESYPNMVTIEDKDGYKGVLMRNEIILPMDYQDIRTYAKSCHTEFPVQESVSSQGRIKDLVFYVRRTGSDTFEEMPLSENPRLQNTVSDQIAEDIRLFLASADSAYKVTAAIPQPYRKEEKEDEGQSSVSSVGKDYIDQWLPYMRRYDPDLLIFLSGQSRQDPQSARSYAEQAIASGCALNLSFQLYSDKLGRRFNKESVLEILSYALFYQRNHLLSDRYSSIDGFDQVIKESDTYRDQVDSLLRMDPDQVPDAILDSPDLRRAAYQGIAKSPEYKSVWYSLLRMDDPVIRSFCTRLIESEESSTVDASYYFLLLGDSARAEQLSLQAVEEAETVPGTGIAASNLIPALFMNGKSEECRDALAQYAYFPTDNRFVVIDGLYQDLRLFLRYGLISRDSSFYGNYLQLLESSCKDVFQGRHSMLCENATVIYYKGNDTHPEHETYHQAFIVANAQPTPVFDAILVPDRGSVGLTISPDGLKGYFDLQQGRSIYPQQAEHAWLFSEGYAVLEEDNRLRVIDSEGRNACGKEFPDPRDYHSPDFAAVDFVFHGGLCPMVHENGKYGLIDTTGSWVLPPEYDYITSPDKNGFRHLMKDGRVSLLESREGILSELPSSHPLVISSQNQVKLWDPRGVRMVSLLDAPEKIKSIHGRDYRSLLLNYLGKDTVYNLQNGQTVPAAELAHMDDDLLSTPDGKRFASSTKGVNEVFITDLETRQTEPMFVCESSFLFFKFSGDGKKAVSVHTDKIARFWDAGSGACLEERDLGMLVNDVDDISNIALSPDGTTLVIARKSFYDNVVMFKPGMSPLVLDAHDDYVRDVCFSHDGKWFASCSDDHSVILFDSKSGRPVGKISVEGSWLLSLRISPDDRQIATLDTKDRLSILDVATGKCVVSKALPNQPLGYIIFWSE